MNMEGVEEEVVAKCNIVCAKQREECRCGELEMRCIETENKCGKLELEIQSMKNVHEELEGLFKAVEVEKRAIEEELKSLRAKSGESKHWTSHGVDGNNVSCGKTSIGGIIDLTEESGEEDEIVQLMIENNVLECEKKKAEGEVEVWKEKFKKLESCILKLDGSVVKCADLQAAVWSTPPKDTPYKDIVPFGRENKDGRLESSVDSGRRVQKQLTFEEENSPGKKMAPSTPGIARPASLGIVDITDSDDESNTLPSVTQTLGKLGDSSLDETRSDQNNEEDVKAFKEPYIILTPKRKRPSNVITSDTESDDDDEIPISKLKRMHIQEPISDEVGLELNSCSVTATIVSDNVTDTRTPTRRRLVALRECEENGKGKKNVSNKNSSLGISTNEDAEDDESGEIGSESEGESLGGFIVNSSDASDGDNGDNASKSEDNSQDNSEDFEDILSKIQRKKDTKLRWEFEGEMLAAFGKDTELCMKAVCALYRQQTSEERISKGTFYYNNRGFSKFDALRGSTLAQFLTDGDSQGDLTKSVEELLEYDPRADELCRTLATHYSKQLFEIYRNKEDPLFLPD